MRLAGQVGYGLDRAIAARRRRLLCQVVEEGPEDGGRRDNGENCPLEACEEELIAQRLLVRDQWARTVSDA